MPLYLIRHEHKVGPALLPASPLSGGLVCVRRSPPEGGSLRTGQIGGRFTPARMARVLYNTSFSTPRLWDDDPHLQEASLRTLR